MEFFHFFALSSKGIDWQKSAPKVKTLVKSVESINLMKYYYQGLRFSAQRNGDSVRQPVNKTFHGECNISVNIQVR